MKTAVAITQKAIDVAEKVIEDVKHAADAVCDAVVSGVAAVQNAWDNLDPGLKQWIINGVAFAISFIPIAGPLISCIIDGTFVDMWNAIQRGDWAMLALSCAAFVPGAGKLAKVGVKGFVKEASGVAKILEKRGIKSYGTLSKELSGSGKQAHHIVEGRWAGKLGVNAKDMPAVLIGKGAAHQTLTNQGRDFISYGKGTTGATLDDIIAQQRYVYQDDPELLGVALDYLSGFR